MDPYVAFYEMNAWDHVMAGIICILAPILAYTSRKISTEDIQLEPEDKIRLYHSNGLLLMVFALVVITTWRIPGRPITGLGIDWPVWHPLIPLLLIIIFLFYAMDIFFQYGSRKKRERTLEKRQKTIGFVPSDSKELFHFLFLALAAGIGEEIIFRGYLIHYLVFWTGTDLVGIALAAVVASGLFAFLHGYQGALSMLKIFFIALLLSAVFILSQSLMLVILAHAVIDIMSGLVSVHLMKDIKEESE